VGIKYEYDTKTPGKLAAMGIVMKRRDNAPITKVVYGGVLDEILLNKNVQAAASFVRSSLMKLVDGDVPIEQLIISKTLRGSYVNPDSIVHAALAKRMRERDPGSAPQINDRVQYAFVVTDNPKALQADRVEDPKFIQENNLPLDYAFYIKSQITEPVKQLFSLVVHELPGARTMALTPRDNTPEAKKKAQKSREDEVTRLLFQPALDKIAQKGSNMRDMRSFFAAM
jgi:DNA polymerase elongation subunit (family B)